MSLSHRVYLLNQAIEQVKAAKTLVDLASPGAFDVDFATMIESLETEIVDITAFYSNIAASGAKYGYIL